jgi:hypothetical protein
MHPPLFYARLFNVLLLLMSLPNLHPPLLNLPSVIPAVTPCGYLICIYLSIFCFNIIFYSHLFYLRFCCLTLTFSGTQLRRKTRADCNVFC